MEFLYGKGVYLEGGKKIEGKIILSQHKLFLKGPQEDFAQTYIPLEKIERIKQIPGGIEVQVRPSLTYRYRAVLKGERKNITDLMKEIIQRRGLKKQFLRKEWVETDT